MVTACCKQTFRNMSRDSSAGRASDRRSEGPRFDPGSRHSHWGQRGAASSLGQIVIGLLGVSIGTSLAAAAAPMVQVLSPSCPLGEGSSPCRPRLAQSRRHASICRLAPRSASAALQAQMIGAMSWLTSGNAARMDLCVQRWASDDVQLSRNLGTKWSLHAASRLFGT